MPIESSRSVRVFYPRLEREELLRRLTEGVQRLASRVAIVEATVFGSVAAGRRTAGSDVDLLIVYEPRAREDVFVLAKNEIAVPRLEPHVYTVEEASRLRDAIERMTRDGIRIYPSPTEIPPAIR